MCRSTSGDHSWWTGNILCHQPCRALPAYQSAPRSDLTPFSPLFQDLTIADLCTGFPLTFLSDLLKKSAPARIVNVSSTNHRRGKVDFSHFHGENLSYKMDTVYNHTKLHNVIWTNELARRLQGSGTEQLSNLHTNVSTVWIVI